MPILKSRRGETLMEGLVSTLVLYILMAAVTMFIMTSLRITGHATMEADDMQIAYNAALAGDETGCNVIAGVHVIVTEIGGFIAFAPGDPSGDCVCLED